MKLVYFLVGVVLFIIVLFIFNLMGEWDRIFIVELIVVDSGVVNVVFGIIFRNWFYDMVFEVIVFMIVILGVCFLLLDEEFIDNFYRLSDFIFRVLVCLGVIIAVMVSIELLIWGYLSLGGGFVAGIVGGIVIGLVVMILLLDKMEKIY